MAAQSVNMTNVTVKQALAQLQQNCGYSFVYEVNDLNTNKRVSVKADNCEEALALHHERQNSDHLQEKFPLQPHTLTARWQQAQRERHCERHGRRADDWSKHCY